MKVSETNVNFGRQAYAKEVDVGLQQEAEKVKAPETSTERSADKVSLSTDARAIQVAKEAVEAAPEVREEVVQEIRQKVDNGTYEVSAQQVADKMVGAKIDELV